MLAIHFNAHNGKYSGVVCKQNLQKLLEWLSMNNRFDWASTEINKMFEVYLHYYFWSYELLFPLYLMKGYFKIEVILHMCHYPSHERPDSRSYKSPCMSPWLLITLHSFTTLIKCIIPISAGHWVMFNGLHSTLYVWCITLLFTWNNVVRM